MARRILVINGHPDPGPERFAAALAGAYIKGASLAGHQIRRLDVGALDFPLIRSAAQFIDREPPSCIREAQEAVGVSDGEGEKPHAGRFLEDLLRDAELSPTRRITCAIDRQAPLGPADKAFVQCYLSELLRRTAGRLPPERWDELRRLAEPTSEGFLPARETFWMTWTDAVVLASRECGR